MLFFQFQVYIERSFFDQFANHDSLAAIARKLLLSGHLIALERLKTTTGGSVPTLWGTRCHRLPHFLNHCCTGRTE